LSISLDPAVIKITSQVSFRCSPEPKDLLFNDAAVNLSFSFRITIYLWASLFLGILPDAVGGSGTVGHVTRRFGSWDKMHDVFSSSPPSLSSNSILCLAVDGRKVVEA
jgi:hypothetical protein